MKETNKIFLMPEYGCDPIWIEEQGIKKNITSDLLPIKSELIQQITEWNDKFQATFNDEYPPESGFLTISEKNTFNQEGCQLTMLLKENLSEAYIIEYLPVHK